jgi:hypothetical protein
VPEKLKGKALRRYKLRECAIAFYGSKWEEAKEKYGEPKHPMIERLRAIAKELEVEPEWVGLSRIEPHES